MENYTNQSYFNGGSPVDKVVRFDQINAGQPGYYGRDVFKGQPGQTAGQVFDGNNARQLETTSVNSQGDNNFNQSQNVNPFNAGFNQFSQQQNPMNPALNTSVSDENGTHNVKGNNWNKIFKTGSSSTLLDLYDGGFGIGKVNVGVTYFNKENTNGENKYIRSYIDFADIFVLAKTTEEIIAADMKYRNYDMIVNGNPQQVAEVKGLLQAGQPIPAHYHELYYVIEDYEKMKEEGFFKSQGGGSKKENDGNQSIVARTIKITSGNKQGHLLVTFTECPGVKSEKGLITPQKGCKMTIISVPMSYDTFRKMVLTLEAHIRGYLTGVYTSHLPYNYE